MSKALFVKHIGALRPVDDAGEDIVKRLGQGELVEVEVRFPRNPQHHRRFFALLQLVWQQLPQDDYPTVESLLTEVKIATGHYDRRDIVFDGRRYPVLTPRSIAFHNMDEDAFSAFVNRVCDWVATNILPGVKQEELREELEQLIGARS